MIDAATVATIRGELDPYVNERAPGFKEGYDDAFYGANTKRLQGLANKAPTYIREVVLHPTLLGVADELLCVNCGSYWLSQAETIFIGPGNDEQELHSDDINWNAAATLGIDLQISVLTAVGDYDAECGATRVIPGSHGKAPGEPFDASEAVPVELEPGDALVYVGSLIHGGGANRTTDRWREGIYCAYLLSWLTPEEATAMSLTPESAAALPERARELLGWGSLRGNPTTDASAEGALQLWQLDDLDLARYDGLFAQD